MDRSLPRIKATRRKIFPRGCVDGLAEKEGGMSEGGMECGGCVIQELHVDSGRVDSQNVLMREELLINVGTNQSVIYHDHIP